MSKLAIRGGKPVREKLFPAYNTIGQEEKEAVSRVLDSGVLSRFLGAWHDDFYGGSEVRALEKEWASYFGIKHAISVNSCTSGLYAAVGAIGTAPGDEIIVSPYTMSASATAPLIYHAIPVFADIEEDYFCLDPLSVEEKITERTKAIIVVDLFGQPYDAERLNEIAKRHGLYVIEDAAQAPGAKYKERYAGTLGDIGIFSLNYHKHIHCGEGGIVVTNDDDIAERVRLIRNHAEAAIDGRSINELTNLVGFNFRMTEIEAAITRCQLKKLEGLLETRIKNCRHLSAMLEELPAISTARERDNCRHAYYVQPFKFNEEEAGITRDDYIKAVRAELPSTALREKEGTKISCGYVKPLYLLPVFQKQVAFGKKGIPFLSPLYKGTVNYSKGICPVTERMHEKKLFLHELMHSWMKEGDLDDVGKAFLKVWNNRDEL